MGDNSDKKKSMGHLFFHEESILLSWVNSVGVKQCESGSVGGIVFYKPSASFNQKLQV